MFPMGFVFKAVYFNSAILFSRLNDFLMLSGLAYIIGLGGGNETMSI